MAPRAAIRPEALLKEVQDDYTKRTYFLTGVISDKAYDEDCVFTGESLDLATMIVSQGLPWTLGQKGLSHKDNMGNMAIAWAQEQENHCDCI